MLRESPNLPGWDESPVQAQIEQILGARVIRENDANAAALGEKWLGAARDVDDMVMLTLGTGVGGGIVLRGRIWHGMNGMAGEFGHMTVEPDGPLVAAVITVAGRASALAASASSDPEFSAKAVYNLAIQGDAEAIASFAILTTAVAEAYCSTKTQEESSAGWGER